MLARLPRAGIRRLASCLLGQAGAPLRQRKQALILTHDNPDPDSLAAAVALAHLLERSAGMEARVGYGGIIGRAENIALREGAAAAGEPRLADRLRRARSVRPGGHPAARWATTRCRRSYTRGHRDRPPPAARGERCRRRSPTWAATTAPPRPCWWSTCARRGWSPRAEVATALFYGIKADTRDLGRETTQTDVDSYLWLFPRIDKRAARRRSSTPSCRRGTSSCTTRRSSGRRCTARAIITDLGEVYSPGHGGRGGRAADVPRGR